MNLLLFQEWKEVHIATVKWFAIWITDNGRWILPVRVMVIEDCDGDLFQVVAGSGRSSSSSRGLHGWQQERHQNAATGNKAKNTNA